MSYITTHNSRPVSISTSSAGREAHDDPFLVNHAISHTFRNQLPVSVSIYTGPYGPYQEGTENNLCRTSDHAEDDAEPGIRMTYDMTIPAMHLGPGVYVPARDFPRSRPATLGKPQPAIGSAYDLFGNGSYGGHGAGPVSAAQYVAVNLPVSKQPTSTTIARDANGNFVPDCDLRNPLPTRVRRG
jgi:hypothetical protein